MFSSYRTDTTVLGCSGFHGDCLTLTKIIDARLKVKWCRKTSHCMMDNITGYHPHPLQDSVSIVVLKHSCSNAFSPFRCTNTRTTRRWPAEPLQPCCPPSCTAEDSFLTTSTTSLEDWMKRVGADIMMTTFFFFKLCLGCRSFFLAMVIDYFLCRLQI